MSVTTTPISIIIPVYNRSQVVMEAVNSVLVQSFDNFELLIVDDCSTDDTPEVLERAARSDGRIQVLRMPQNGGAAAARNYGFRHAQSKLIALLDSDDTLHPEFLVRSVAAHAGREGEPFFTRTGVFHLHDGHSGGSARNTGDTYDPDIWKIDPRYLDKPRPYLYEIKFGTAAGIVFNREFLRVVGTFDERLPAAEDTDLFIRASEVTLGEVIPHRLIYKYESGDDRLTKNYGKLLTAYELIYEKNREFILQDKFLQRKFSQKMTRLALFAARKGTALALFGKSLSVNLSDPGYLIKFFAGVVLPPSLFTKLYTESELLKKRTLG